MTFQEFSQESHSYYSDGKHLLSVTQILEQAGKVSSFCKDDEAAWRGTSVHQLCHDRDLNGALDLRTVPADLRGYVRAWAKYQADSGFKASLIEHRVDCLSYGYAGRFDRLGYLPDKAIPVMLDIKTSKAGTVAPYTRLQLSAYCFAYAPSITFQRIAVALKPDGNYKAQIYPVSDFQIDRAEWLELVRKIREEKNERD